MAENPTDLIGEFQKLRHETSGISRNLMARTRSVDARRNSSSNPNNEVLKAINEKLEAIRKENEAAQKKQSEELKVQMDAQNRMMKEVLSELRSARMEIAEIKKKQTEDSEMLENINTTNNQIEESLMNPTIAELCGLWESRNWGDRSFHSARQNISVEGNTLTWMHSRKKHYIVIADVKIGSNGCKIREDGKVEIVTDRGDKYEFEAHGRSLTIKNGETCYSYTKC